MNHNIEIYENDQQQIEVLVDGHKDTVWLSQAHLVNLFERDQSVISRHLRNVFKEGELDSETNMQKMHTAKSDKPVVFYSLDVIISVGYRVKSPQGVRFRKWATQRLKEYLVQGYTINQQRLEQNAQELQQTITLIQKTAKSPELTAQAGSGLVDIVSRYTQTFLWLQRYDEGLLNEPEGQAGGTLPDAVEAMAALLVLKKFLMDRGEATELFARPRGEGLSALLGNLDQTVFCDPAYPTIESKAAHLLYFVVKNHPFADGNKRSGAYLFVDFLHRNNRLIDAEGIPCINDTGLAALTLLVAESKPDQKETLIRLIMNMLTRNG